jgi:hypothetical protein
MIGLRPILSDSQPNNTKPPEPSTSDQAISMFVVKPSTFSTEPRKNSA